MTDAPPSLSLVIPAYNEALRLAAGFERLRPTLEALGADTEVIVIDDGSSDDTLRVAQRVYGHLENARFVQQPVNRGKGAAVRLGVALARGARVIATDADMSIRPSHLPEIVAALDAADLAPGSRVLNEHIDYDSPLRTAAGKAFNVLVRHYTGTTLRDTQCGCKGYRLGAARVMGLLGYTDRFIFDAEMLLLAQRLGLAVTPVPVTWDDVAGSSVRLARDSLQMIRDLRALGRTHYANPVVEVEVDVDVARVAQLAREARVLGAVVARSATNALVVLGHDAALGAHAIADGLNGVLRTADITELSGRRFDAV